MLDWKSLKSEIPQLPLAEREKLLSLLEQSIASEHRTLAEAAEAENLAICVERCERAGHGQMDSVPFGNGLKMAFGDR